MQGLDDRGELCRDNMESCFRQYGQDKPPCPWKAQTFRKMPAKPPALQSEKKGLS